MADLRYMELNLMQIFDVLRAAGVARLAVCSGGQPYVVPVTYQLEADGSAAVLHLASPGSGRKLDMLRRNKNVCLEAELPSCAWLDTVLLEGEAAIGAAAECGVFITVKAETLSGRRYFLP